MARAIIISCTRSTVSAGTERIRDGSRWHVGFSFLALVADPMDTDKKLRRDGEKVDPRLENYVPPRASIKKTELPPGPGK